MAIAILILMALLAVYVISSYLSDKLSVLQVAEAGSASYFNKNDRPRVKPLTNADININEYHQFAVHGSCMQKRHIYNGNIILSKIFKKDDNKEKMITEKQVSQILLIYLYDRNYKGFKIREFEGWTENGDANTFYYNSDGSRRYSSKPHKLEQIVGTVDYVIHDSTSTASNIKDTVKAFSPNLEIK